MNSFLITIAVLIVTVLVALFIGPSYVDWNRYKDVFELHASNMMGREVRVRGDVNLRLLPAPYVQFERVSISGTPGKAEENFVEVGGFKLWLSVPTLLQGNVQAKQVELLEPHFNIHIDREGRGNWQDIGNVSADVPFLPKDVALDAVSITQGKISFRQALSQEPVLIENINGALSASSLEGPYNFSGHFEYGGERRNLRFSTARPDTKGAIRVKSLLEVPATASRYAVEGDLKGLGDVISLDAVLDGEIPIDWLSMIEQGAESHVSASKYEEKKLIEIKSRVSADLKRLEFQELALTINDMGKQQSIKGNAVLDWEQGLNLTTQLKATQIDFDRMLGDRTDSQVVVSAQEPVQKVVTDKIPTAQEVAKVYKDIAEQQAAGAQAQKEASDQSQSGDERTVQRGIKLFSSALQKLGLYLSKATVKAEMTEAKLGGSQLNEFTLHLTKDKEEFRIVELSAELPGRNALSLEGQLIPKNNNLSFAGPVKLKGASLGALSYWILPRNSEKNIFEARPYHLEGQVELAPGRLDVSDFKGELNGSAITGLFKYDFAEKKEFILELNSKAVDLSDVFDQKATVRSLLMGLASSSPAQNEKKSESQKSASQTSETSGMSDQSFAEALADLEGKINLKIGTLKLPTFSGRDILADGQLSKGQFSLNTFSMTVGEALKFKGQGNISNLKDEAVGTLNLSIEADTANGARDLFRQMDLPGQMSENDEAASVFSPLKLSVTMTLENKDNPSTDIVVAGDMAGSKLSINTRHDGSLKSLGSKQLDISGTLTNPDSRQLIRQLARGEKDIASSANGRGAISIQASGIPERGIETRARMDAGPVQARYNGTVQFSGGQTNGQGDLTIKSADAASGLAVLGLRDISAYANKSLDLAAQVKKERDSYEIIQLIGSVGSLNFNGKGSVSFPDQANEAPVKISGNLTTSQLSLPSLVAYLAPSALPSDIKQLAEATSSDLGESWSKIPFDTQIMKKFDGQLSVKFGEMDLGGDVPLKEGELQARFYKNGLEVKKLNGSIYGGKLSSQIFLSQESGPVQLKASVSLKNADLATIFKKPGSGVLARGEGDIQLNLSGQGLSPLGLVSVLDGDGKMSARSGEIFEFSPSAITEAMEASKADKAEDAFVKAFSEKLKSDSFPFKTVTGSIDVKAGAVSVQNLSLSSGQTTLTATALFELPSLKFDSEWNIDMRNKTTEGVKETLPGVKVVFAGKMSDIGKIAPVINAEDLQRVLAVRKMEEDVKTLEKLNANDPETIRRLTEQKRLQDLQQGQSQADQKLSPQQTPPQQTTSDQQSDPKRLQSVQPALEKTAGQGEQQGAQPSDQQSNQNVIKLRNFSAPQQQPSGQVTSGENVGGQSGGGQNSTNLNSTGAEILPWLNSGTGAEQKKSGGSGAGQNSQHQAPSEQGKLPALNTLGTGEAQSKDLNSQDAPGQPYTFVKPEQNGQTTQRQNTQGHADTNQGGQNQTVVGQDPAGQGQSASDPQKTQAHQGQATQESEKKKEEPSFFERLFGG